MNYVASCSCDLEAGGRRDSRSVHWERDHGDLGHKNREAKPYDRPRTPLGGGGVTDRNYGGGGPHDK